MSSILLDIEQNLHNELLTIRKVSTLPSGYTYKNDVSVVNIDDMAVAIDRGDFPFISITRNNQTGKFSLITNNRYDRVEYYTLICYTSLLDTADNPRYAIREQLYSVLDDVIACVNNNNTLNCSCECVDIIDNSEQINLTGDILAVGNIKIDISIHFTQNTLNPNERY